MTAFYMFYTKCTHGLLLLGFLNYYDELLSATIDSDSSLMLKVLPMNLSISVQVVQALKDFF